MCLQADELSDEEDEPVYSLEHVARAVDGVCLSFTSLCQLRAHVYRGTITTAAAAAATTAAAASESAPAATVGFDGGCIGYRHGGRSSIRRHHCDNDYSSRRRVSDGRRTRCVGCVLSSAD